MVDILRGNDYLNHQHEKKELRIDTFLETVAFIYFNRTQYTIYLFVLQIKHFFIAIPVPYLAISRIQ